MAGNGRPRRIRPPAAPPPTPSPQETPMPRLPLLTDDQVGPPDLVAAIRQRRGGDLLDLDRLLLHSPAFAADPVFDADQQAVLALVVEMTRQVKVDAATFDCARTVLGSDALMFELVGVIAAYNMVARILVALDLKP